MGMPSRLCNDRSTAGVTPPLPQSRCVSSSFQRGIFAKGLNEGGTQATFACAFRSVSVAHGIALLLRSTSSLDSTGGHRSRLVPLLFWHEWAVGAEFVRRYGYVAVLFFFGFFRTYDVFSQKHRKLGRKGRIGEGWREG